MKEVKNNIGIITLLEELKDLILEMYCARIKIKMEIAISGVKYDITDLEMLEAKFNKQLELIEESLNKNDYDNIKIIAINFGNELKQSRLIPVNLTITALNAQDRILPVISDFISKTITEIDRNLENGINGIGKTL